MRIILLFISLISVLSSCTVRPYPSHSEPVSHIIWDSLLQEHVRMDGSVNYQGFIQDSLRLNAYLDILSGNHPNEQSWNRNERMAYWINAYNAFTIKLITDHYPVGSIKDIKGGIPFVNSVWDVKFILIEGATYDLNNIEHGILRPKFEDARIHFAINCASISCPRLAAFAYTPDQLDRQLDQAARSFLADESRNIIRNDHLEISRIFSWFRGDFTKEGNLTDFIRQYAPIEIAEKPEIDFLPYDWNLNDIK